MDEKLGLTSEQGMEILFSRMKGQFVDEDNENYPKDETSPNYPRADERIQGYPNPILGDDGYGKIGRWEEVKADALHTLVEQMIAHYMKDKEWYASVRCREALWNMYRRLDWYVRNQVEPGDNDYAQALRFIRENIINILDANTVEESIGSYTFENGIPDEFTTVGDWFVDKNGNLTCKINIDEDDWDDEDWEVEYSAISIRKRYSDDGYVRFGYAMDYGVSELVLRIDGKKVWEDTFESALDSGHSFREVTINVPKGNHLITWEVSGDVDGVHARFNNISFIEKIKADEDKEGNTLCPAPYEHTTKLDYHNNFTSEGSLRPTFSTKSGATTTDFMDMIRYVSPQEHVEWKMVRDMRGEYVGDALFKVPLENLPETMSTKMTLDWRTKAKGEIRFEYYIDSGGGADLRFYVNGKQVTNPLGDTNGQWESVSVGIGTAQTNKYDWIVTNNNAMNTGLNAVYIKNIEIFEKTDATDFPMPKDYDEVGEEALKDHNRWAVYSNGGYLATYYRGFVDGEEDKVRDFNFSLTNEDDGVISFRHILGTKFDTKIHVDEEIFRERHFLDETPVVWVGEDYAMGAPTYTTTPKYDKFEGQQGLHRRLTTKEDGATADYVVTESDDNWKGPKSFTVYGKMMITCPPETLVKEDYEKSPMVGTLRLGRDWSGDVDEFRLSTRTESEDSEARLRITDDYNGYVDFTLEGKLDDFSRLDIYRGSMLYKTIFSGPVNRVVRIFLSGGDSVRFKYRKDRVENGAGGSTINISMTDSIRFGDNYELKPLGTSDDKYDDARSLNNRDYIADNTRDGRGVVTRMSRGSLHNRGSWYTSGGYKQTVYLHPKDIIEINTKTNKIEYIDKEKVAEEVDKIVDKSDIESVGEPFIETYNPETQAHRKQEFGEWRVVDIFEESGMGNRGDKVNFTYLEDNSRVLTYTGFEPTDNMRKLTFEYGALFGGGGLNVFAITDSGRELLYTTSENDITTTGTTISGITLPKGTTAIEFVAAGG